MYVYKFLNHEGEIIYIGRTKDMNNRQTSHNHLSKQCYNETKQIQYIELCSYDEMCIYERYLINKIAPKYNTEFNNNSDFSFELPEKEWKVYVEEKRIKIKNKKTYEHFKIFEEPILYKPNYLLCPIENEISNGYEKIILDYLLWHYQNCKEELTLDMVASFLEYPEERGYKASMSRFLRNLINKSITYECEQTGEIKKIIIVEDLIINDNRVFYKLNNQIEKDLVDGYMAYNYNNNSIIDFLIKNVHKYI